MKKIISCLFLIVLFVVFVNSSFADLDIGWQPDSPIYVGQTDTIQIFGTIYNSSSSTEVLDLTSIIGNGAGAGTTWGTLIYNSTYASGNPYDYNPEVSYHPEFKSLILYPGESYQFLYATLTPVNPPVDLGIYESEMTINFNTEKYGLLDMGYEHVVVNVVSEPISSIYIDIKPGSYPNRINLKSKGVIPVAILTNEDFDATTVDPLLVTFGVDDALEAHGSGHIEDVDEDGDLDLLLHFYTQETGIVCGDIEAGLMGETFDGQMIEGFDSIHIVKCK